MINSVKKTSFVLGASLALLLGCTTASAELEAPAIETSAPAAKSLAAVAINTADLATAVEFYESVFGLTEVRAFETEAFSERILATGDAGGTKLVLVQAKDKAVPSVPTRIVFYTDKIDAVMSAIKARNLPIIRDVTEIPGTGGVKNALAKDADGYILELLQKPEAH